MSDRRFGFRTRALHAGTPPDGETGARALVRDPHLLLLDEPFAALDALRRIELRAAVHEILTLTRASAILVTHDVDDALAIADRVIVLAGSPAEVAFTGNVGETATRSAILDALGVIENGGHARVRGRT